MTRGSVPEKAAAPERAGNTPEGAADPSQAEPASLGEDAIRVMNRLTNRLVLANIFMICVVALILAYKFFWAG